MTEIDRLPAAVYPPIHGHAVMVRVPSALDPNADVVLVDRRCDYERYVTGLVRASNPIPVEWWIGHYFNDLRAATADLLER